MQPEVTALLLNWKRPENLKRTIASLRSQSIPVAIWLWNNNPEDRTPYDVDQKFEAPRNFYCWPRWLLGSLIDTEFLFTLDDDLTFGDGEVLVDALSYLKQLPLTSIVGYCGVQLDSDRNYWQSKHYHQPEVDREVGVDIVKGRFMLMRKKFIGRISLENEPTCEDIKVSSYSEKKILPSILRGRLIDLPEGSEALHANPEQRKRRVESTLRYFR